MTAKKPLSDNARATIVASIVALTLVIIKVTVGILSGAMVLIASAVDSGLDFLVSAFNHLAVRNAERPSDDRFNYGRGKIEGLASFLEGLVIAVSSGIIVFSAVLKIIRGGTLSHPIAATSVMVVSVIFTAALVAYMSRIAKRTGSLVLKADVLHYKMDLWVNCGILAALAVINQTGWEIIDPIFSIGIAIYIFYTSIGLMREGLEMLLDHALPKDITKGIMAILEDPNNGVSDYHALKTRSCSKNYFVDVHLVFHREISLLEAHHLSDKIEARIQKLQDVNWLINVHMDPVDDSKRDNTIP